MTIKKSQVATSDGLYVYDFSGIPQETSCVKVHALFLKDDKQAMGAVASILQSHEEARKCKIVVEETLKL